MQMKEIGSGASLCEHRGKLLEAARCREIDVVLVWGLDRRRGEPLNANTFNGGFLQPRTLVQTTLAK